MCCFLSRFTPLAALMLTIMLFTSPSMAEKTAAAPAKAEAETAAQPTATTADKPKQPIEIEADQQLEWLRNQSMYRGTGNITITQGDTIIRGDYAEAHYDGAIGPSALTTMTVKGNVTITNKDRVIRGDQGAYDTRTEIMIVTGQNVTLTTPTMSAKANERMEYHAAANKAIAKGKAEVTQPGQKIKAETITAFFHPDTSALERAHAVGNVFITKQQANGVDIAQSHQADYDVKKDSVELKGNVKLTRGDNHMQGNHAVIDLKTGYSTLKNTGGKSNGRVRAVFNTGN